ncbi:hypothetical protein [Lonepinella koalarum]|uniref:hypothetical protein n=1 Tax=Lonepinella koalarum TaxID=53417 RepID=UPI0037042514
MIYLRIDISDILWVYWATPRLGTEYPSLSVSIPVPPVMKSKRVVPIKDELAMEIDRCVCVMKKSYA